MEQNNKEKDQKMKIRNNILLFMLFVVSMFFSYFTICGVPFSEISDYPGQDVCDLTGGAPWMVVILRAVLFYFFGLFSNYILTHGKEWFR